MSKNWRDITHKSRNPRGLDTKQGRTMADEEEDEIGPWKDRRFEYRPPKDIGGSPLWVVKFDEDIWLGYKEKPKNPREVMSKPAHMATGRDIQKRLKMGEWLRQEKPRDDEMLPLALFIEGVDPVPYDELFDDSEETPEGQAIIEQVDMAMAVIDAGGDCIVCNAKRVEGNVNHELGCYLPGFSIWRMLHPEDMDRTPSLAMVIRAAEEQIARMR